VKKSFGSQAVFLKKKKNNNDNDNKKTSRRPGFMDHLIRTSRV
jgi:hypothetical protein